MKKNKKEKKQHRKSFLFSISRELKAKPVVGIVYIILRTLVIISLLRQFLNQNFENVLLCILTLILFLLPTIVEKELHVDFPDFFEIVIMSFIFAAEILGEINAFYTIIPGWDTMLHTLNGFLCAALGFSLVDLLNRNKHFSFSLSAGYMALTAFCFSMTVGVLWEFFEYFMDSVFLFDMQKDFVVTQFGSVSLDPTGTNKNVIIKDIADVIIVQKDGTQIPLGLGGYLDIGIKDTMKDLFVNFVGAVSFSVLGGIYVKVRDKRNAKKKSSLVEKTAAKTAKALIPIVLDDQDVSEDFSEPSRSPEIENE